jgi:hypothetical protein
VGRGVKPSTNGVWSGTVDSGTAREWEESQIHNGRGCATLGDGHRRRHAGSLASSDGQTLGVKKFAARHAIGARRIYCWRERLEASEGAEPRLVEVRLSDAARQQGRQSHASRLRR